MNRFYSLPARVAGRLSRIAMQGPPFVQAFYFGVVSGAFRRERAAVAAGIRRNRRSASLDPIAFRLRKTVHTLEKGLTMRPRRPEFGLGLIGSALDDAGDILDRWPSHFDSDEGRWIIAVLVEYFDATAASTSEVLISARSRFESMRERVVHVSPEGAGPAVPRSSGDSASVGALISLAQQRGSVRWFLPEAVDRTRVDAAIRVAMESPTACNRQPYRYLVFDDPTSVLQVAAVPMGTRGWRHQIPGIVVLVGDLSAYVDERDRHLIYIDSALSATGFLLGLESQGVASCVINWPDIAHREKEMRRLLNLQPHERVVMLIAYGYADPEGLVPHSAKRHIDAVREYKRL